MKSLLDPNSVTQVCAVIFQNFCAQNYKEKSIICFLGVRPFLSSPHAKRASPKGLHAESARAATGRQCPHSGEGEDFLMGQLIFFTKTALTPERKVEKLIPRWEINRHAKG